jgi:hypothetical protein
MRILRILFALLTVLPGAASVAQSTKPVIGIAEITTEIDAFNTMSIQLALENAFIKTNKFTTIERTRLATLMQEQGLTLAGITNGTAQLGGFSGVDYLVIGSVTNITVEAKNLLIVLNCDATLSMNIRVVDTMTGEIRISENLTTTATVGTVAEGDPCSGISLSSINVIGEEGADGIANKMTMAIFPIKVARITDVGEVYLNYGEGTLSRGSVLSLKTLGAGVVDPDTGEVLGTEETTNGIVVINDVRPAFSIGSLVTSTAPVSVGDIAYPVQETRSSQRAIRACVSAQEKKVDACNKDPSSRACTRQTAEVPQSCNALMAL